MDPPGYYIAASRSGLDYDFRCVVNLGKPTSLLRASNFQPRAGHRCDQVYQNRILLLCCYKDSLRLADRADQQNHTISMIKHCLTNRVWPEAQDKMHGQALRARLL
jgi:hypothetical protein